MTIETDGRWVHEGRTIRRESLVKLFAGILRREDDGEYYLVTPVEKWRIQVNDSAFHGSGCAGRKRTSEADIAICHQFGRAR